MCPYDTTAEAVKVIEDALKAANAADHFSLWINFSSYKYWNKDLAKYEYENFKKGSDADEVEDLIAKLCLDKKIIKVIEDPFILEHKFSWHRLNVKHDNDSVKTKREGALSNVCFKTILHSRRREEKFLI